MKINDVGIVSDGSFMKTVLKFICFSLKYINLQILFQLRFICICQIDKLKIILMLY